MPLGWGVSISSGRGIVWVHGSCVWNISRSRLFWVLDPLSRPWAAGSPTVLPSSPDLARPPLYWVAPVSVWYCTVVSRASPTLPPREIITLNNISVWLVVWKFSFVNCLFKSVVHFLFVWICVCVSVCECVCMCVFTECTTIYSTHLSIWISLKFWWL